jgi:hypothetical protein
VSDEKPKQWQNNVRYFKVPVYLTFPVAACAHFTVTPNLYQTSYLERYLKIHLDDSWAFGPSRYQKIRIITVDELRAKAE